MAFPNNSANGPTVEPTQAELPKVVRIKFHLARANLGPDLCESVSIPVPKNWTDLAWLKCLDPRSRNLLRYCSKVVIFVARNFGAFFFAEPDTLTLKVMLRASDESLLPIYEFYQDPDSVLFRADFHRRQPVLRATVDVFINATPFMKELQPVETNVHFWSRYNNRITEWSNSQIFEGETINGVVQPREPAMLPLAFVQPSGNPGGQVQVIAPLHSAGRGRGSRRRNNGSGAGNAPANVGPH